MYKLSDFSGNILSREEKEVRLKYLNQSIKRGFVDKEFLPYLEELNKYNIMTTQCCCGHKGNRAYLEFRSGLTEQKTEKQIILPMLREWEFTYSENYIIDYERNFHKSFLIYTLFFNKIHWKDQVKFLIKILKKGS